MHCSVLLQGVAEVCQPLLMLWAFRRMITEVWSALFGHQSAHPDRVLNFEKLTYRYRAHHIFMGTSSTPWISGTLLVHGPFWVEEVFLYMEIFRNDLDAILSHVLWDGTVWAGRLDQTTCCGASQPDPSCDSVILHPGWTGGCQGHRLVFLAESQPSLWDDTNLQTSSLSAVWCMSRRELCPLPP